MTPPRFPCTRRDPGLVVLVVVITIAALLIASGPPGSAAASDQHRIEARIVAGAPVRIDQYPWQVALENRAGQFCGGAIVGTRSVVTAAHCVDGTRPAAITIRAGTARLDRPGQTRQVERIVMHPNWRPASNRNDIAVLLLDRDLALGSGVAPIRYQGEAVGRLSRDGTAAWVSGWGATGETAPGSDQLLAVGVPVMSDARCQEALRPQGASIHEPTMICAGGAAGDSCYGDSGGPLIARDGDGTPYLIGIVSWGVVCGARGVPGVYADVATLQSWIADEAGPPPASDPDTDPRPDPGPGPDPDRQTTTVTQNRVLRIPRFGPANRYPTTVRVDGARGRVVDVDVVLHGLTHGSPYDLDIVLVAPDGTQVTLMSEAGGFRRARRVDVRLDDEAATELPDRLARSGRFQPTSKGAQGMPAAVLAAFDGSSPNGRWRLFVHDSAPRDRGQIRSWSLVITTQ